MGVGENLWSAVAVRPSLFLSPSLLLRSGLRDVSRRFACKNGAPPARLVSTQPQGSTSLATSSAVVSSSLAQRTSSPGGPSNCQKCASTSPVETSASPEEFTPSASQISRGVELFFCHIATFLPFLHRPTFDPSAAADYLLPAILALGYQYGDDPDSDEVDCSGVDLSLRCFRLSRVLIERRGEDPADSTQSLAVVQAYILLQAYSMFYLPGSSEGLRMHSKVVDVSALPSHPFSRSFVDRLLLRVRHSSLAQAVSCSLSSPTQARCQIWKACGGSLSRRRVTNGTVLGSRLQTLRQTVSDTFFYQSVILYLTGRCSTYTTWTPFGISFSPSLA